MIILKISQLLIYEYITRNQVFKFIEKTLLIISVITILITLLWDFNYIRYTPPINHKNWESITLYDFKGLKKPYMTMDGESKFAFVSTSIRVKKHQDKIIVESFFNPCRSYVYNRKLFADGLLKHEMYHFHITEYCARYMKKEIHDFIEFGVDYNLSKFKKQILVYEQSLQLKYDDETYHSYVYGKQLEWQNKIDSLLKSVEEFSNPTLSLKKNQEFK